MGRVMYDMARESIGYQTEYDIKGYIDDNIHSLDTFTGYPPIGRAFVNRADAALPLVFEDERAAGPAHDRDFEVAQKAVDMRSRFAVFPDDAVVNNAVVAVFEHLPVNRRRDFDRVFRERNDDLRRRRRNRNGRGGNFLREKRKRRGAEKRR